MKLGPDLSEFIALLNAHGVEHVIVGGYAVAYYGHPRFTGDLDIMIRPSPGNVQSLLDALEEFGFGELELTTEDFTEPNVIVQLGRPPSRIDLLTSIDGVDTQQVFAHRVREVDEANVVWFISREDLIRNKKATGRTQDLADLEHL